MKPTSTASSISGDATGGHLERMSSDRELTEQIAHGGPDGDAAYNQLYVRYARDILAFLESRLPFRAPAEDIAQDVWIIVHQKIRTFDGKNFRAWLYEIARNRATDDLRRVIRRKEVPGTTQWDDLICESVEEDVQLVAMRDCLHQLDGPFIRILINNKLDGKSVEDLAKQESIQVATVYTRIDRAKRQLSDCVQRKLS